MKKIIIRAVTFCLCFIATTIFSDELPRSLSSDHRMKTVIFQKNNIVRLYGSILVNTQIILGLHEQVIDIQCGDSAAWSVNVSAMIPNVVNIKPMISGSNTSLSISTTDAHQHVKHYFFNLHSSSSTDPSLITFSIRFINPSKVIPLNHSSYKKYFSKPFSHHTHWDYRYHGCKTIVPQHVFDNGHFTFFMLRDHQPIPAFFVVDDKHGHETLINVHHEGQYWVVYQTAPQFTLRGGQYCVASIFNHRLIKTINHSSL
ncbi:MAG: hypothetical protein CL816_01075 [Coxiellaceae bacterium]|nr:hypothetical protein [Coxiellaceae bacterium]